jgi:hypothetical protein
MLLAGIPQERRRGRREQDEMRGHGGRSADAGFSLRGAAGLLARVRARAASLGCRRAAS